MITIAVEKRNPQWKANHLNDAIEQLSFQALTEA